MLKIYPCLFDQLEGNNSRTPRIAAYLLLLWGRLSGSNAVLATLFGKVLAMALILAVFGLAVWRSVLNDSEENLAASAWSRLKKTLLNQPA